MKSTHHLLQEEPTTYDYTLGTVKLIRVRNEKDLGVITSYELGSSYQFHHLEGKQDVEKAC